MAKIVRIFPKPPPNPADLTRGSKCNGIAPPRRRTEHIYSTIEDAENDPLDLDLDLPVLGGVGVGTGVYSEPEHFYTCIDDLSEKSKSKLGEKVSVEVEKDSDISEEEGNSEGKKPELKQKPENGKHEFEVSMEWGSL
jgi:hypothetical protein